MTNCNYAGESNAKKVARAWAYQCVARHLPESRRGSAKVVALAGPQAHDLGPLRAFGIASDPTDVLLVDTNRDAISAAERIAPGVRTFHGDIANVSPPWPVDVAVFDWCGAADSPSARKAYLNFRQHLRLGSIVVVTFLRGREGPAAMPRQVLKICGRKLRRAMAHDQLGLARSFSVWCFLSTALGYGVPGGPRRDSDLELFRVGNFPYQGHASPMATHVFRLGRRMDRRRFLDAGDATFGAIPHGAADPAEMLEMVDRLESAGIDPALALSVRPGTIAAWRAHRTMGSYPEATGLLRTVRPTP